MSGELTRGEAVCQGIELTNKRLLCLPHALVHRLFECVRKVASSRRRKPHLEWLACGYAAMQITDDHFAWSRASHLWRSFVQVSKLVVQRLAWERAFELGMSR